MPTNLFDNPPMLSNTSSNAPKNLFEGIDKLNLAQLTPESQGAVKQANGTYRGPTLMEGLKQATVGAGNYFGKEAISLGQSALKIPGKAVPGYNTFQQAIQTGEDIKTQMNPQNKAQRGGATAAQVGEIALPLAKPIAGAIENAPKVLSGAKSLINAGKETIGKLAAGKSEQEILSTVPENVAKLNPAERKVWFDNQTQIINSQAENATQQAKGLLKTQAENSTKVIEDLQKQLVVSSRDKVIELRPKIVQAMGEQSKIYRNLVDEEMAGKTNIPIKIADLKGYIDTQYADNPNLANSIKQKLGLDTSLNPNTKAPFKTSVGEIYNQVKSLKSDISAGASRGTKVFTSDDVNTDKAINTLTGFLKTQGVDFSEANKFWSKYAPIRNQLVSEAKPFLQTGTQTKTFANTLMRVAKGTDINNENFINQVEDLLGKPINSENKAIVAKLSETEKTALANKVAAEEKIMDANMAKDAALKKLSSQQFQVERQARLKSIVKKVIFATVLYGADKTLKKYTGIGF